MSRTATNEYTGAKRRAYAASKPDKRRLIPDDVCEMTGYSRKYANRLLTGSRKFKVRKGRCATYTEQDKTMLIRIWREVGCPCTTYFRANIVEWLQEFRTCVTLVPDNMATHLLSMSASTMDRLLKGVKREKPGSMQRNRRSGRNDVLLKAIESKSGELVMGCDVPPGDIQTDTVAHCGGDMSGDFWWTLTATDRKTQYARVLADPAVPKNVKDALRLRKKKINGIELYHRILKRLRRIRRIQSLPDGSSPVPVSSALAPDAPLRGRPSLPGTGRNNAATNQLNPSIKCPAFDELGDQDRMKH